MSGGEDTAADLVDLPDEVVDALARSLYECCGTPVLEPLGIDGGSDWSECVMHACLQIADLHAAGYSIVRRGTTSADLATFVVEWLEANLNDGQALDGSDGGGDLLYGSELVEALPDAIAAALANEGWVESTPDDIDDGFGNTWTRCGPRCDLHVVRPGKVQCSGRSAWCLNEGRE